ncbi:hypothetical protein GIB67_018481 [Kingdonia uniflora]|uniref:Uncharacterized protein n=1 Tax=Kingdonia uniflora TaxID=39325 RepID=A0A7J7LW97_9MAGN|nr:hypothetical protein GIB67_018481 [Kingdonia uniflora]
MLNLTMSLEEEEYDGTGDEEGSESDYSEGHVSQLRFLLGKKRKNDFEEVFNASIEPPLPLPQNYEARNFRQLTQPDGKGHLSTLVFTTSSRVGFKCRSVLVKLRKIYVIFIEGIEVEWEDEAGTSQVGTSGGRGSRGRGSRGRTSEGGDAPPRRPRRTRGSFV